jgi:hypothetical protein
LPAILAEVPVACPLSPRGGPRRFRLRRGSSPGPSNDAHRRARSHSSVWRHRELVRTELSLDDSTGRAAGWLAASSARDSNPGPSNDAHRQRAHGISFGLRSNASFSHASPTSARPLRSPPEGCPRSLLRYRSLVLSHPVAGLAASVCAGFEPGSVVRIGPRSDRPCEARTSSKRDAHELERNYATASVIWTL